MPLQLEPFGSRRLGERPVEGLFGPLRQRDVADLSTPDADQMVMVVLREVLAELVMGVLVAHRDLADESDLFEDRQVPVDGALREARLPLEDLRDRDRTSAPARTPSTSDGRTSAAAVGLQPDQRDLVEVVHVADASDLQPKIGTILTHSHYWE